MQTIEINEVKNGEERMRDIPRMHKNKEKFSYGKGLVFFFFWSIQLTLSKKKSPKIIYVARLLY